MKIKKLAIFILMTLSMAAAIGCGSESGLSVTSEEPTSITGDTIVNLPYVVSVGVEGADPYNLIDGTKRRILVTFSGNMDPATVTTANIRIRDITAAIADITIDKLDYIPSKAPASGAKVYLYYTLPLADQTDKSREIFVSRNVKDMMGNGITPYNNIAGYRNVNTDYRKVIHESATVPFTVYPNYNPLFVNSINITAITDVSATVTVTFSRPVTKTSVTTANFTVTPAATIGTATYDTDGGVTTDDLYANSISFPLTVLTHNTVYSVTINPAGIVIAPTMNQYPYIATSVFTETDLNFRNRRTIEYIDTYITDFVKKFATDYNPSPYVAPVYVSNVTGLSSTTVQVTFSAAIDPATVIADNFIAYTRTAVTVNGSSTYAYSPVEVKLIPYLAVTTGDITVVDLTTLADELTKASIYRVVIKNSVKSKNGVQIDGNDDGNLLGTVDITGDDVADDDHYKSWM